MTTILILIVIGILALAIELFVPGGILGLAGGACLVAASVLTFRDYGFLAGLIVSVSLAAFCLWLLWFWMRHFHRMPFARDMILDEKGRRGRGMTERVALVGSEGVALTDLSPSGYVRCGEEKIHAIAESGAIPAGSVVLIVRQKGPGWVVRTATAGG